MRDRRKQASQAPAPATQIERKELVGNSRKEGGQRTLSRREAIEAGVALAVAAVLAGVLGCSRPQPSGQSSDGGGTTGTLPTGTLPTGTLPTGTLPTGTLPAATAGAADWPQWQGPNR